jgi:PleD family two-component response regulator
MNRHVIAAVSDMIFASKIRGTGEQSNVSVSFARSADSLFDAAKTEVPSLIILDLHATQLDPFALAARLKADDQLRSVPLIGFFSHVQTELQARAVEAGFDQVLPRSAFTKHLPEILRGEF